MPNINKCICENCKHYNPDEYYCSALGEDEMYPEDTCENWEENNKPTIEEQKENAGDIEARRIIVEGREIL